MDDLRREIIATGRKVVAELRSLGTVLLGIQEQAKTVAKECHAQSERKESPPILRAELQIPEAIEDERKSENRKKVRREGYALVLNCLTLLAVLTYAVINYYMWCETRKAARTASESLAQTQEQVSLMKSGQRPWLGVLGRVTLTNAPVFHILPSHRPDTTGVRLTIDGSFVIHNFGTSPAFDGNSESRVEFLVSDSTITRPPVKRMVCPDGLTKQHQGEVIFPGSAINQGFSHEFARVIPGKKITEIGRIWLLGCISYHDVDRQIIHHTKFWLRSNFPDRTPWIQLTPDFRYMPVISFESWGEEAD